MSMRALRARAVDRVEVGLSGGARLGFEGCQVTRTAADGAAAMTLVQVERPDRRLDTAGIIPTITREVPDEGVADAVSAAGTDLGTTAQAGTGTGVSQVHCCPRVP
jgi:hypothetical protein